MEKCWLVERKNSRTPKKAKGQKGPRSLAMDSGVSLFGIRVGVLAFMGRVPSL